MLSSDDKASQSDHASFIRQVRKEENLYGLTHSEARKQVQGETAAAKFATFVQGLEKQNTAPLAPAPHVTTSEVQLNARPIPVVPPQIIQPPQALDGGLPKYQTTKILVCDMSDPDTPTSRYANLFEKLPMP